MFEMLSQTTRETIRRIRPRTSPPRHHPNVVVSAKKWMRTRVEEPPDFLQILQTPVLDFGSM